MLKSCKASISVSRPVHVNGGLQRYTLTFKALHLRCSSQMVSRASASLDCSAPWRRFRVLELLISASFCCWITLACSAQCFCSSCGPALHHRWHSAKGTECVRALLEHHRSVGL